MQFTRRGLLASALGYSAVQLLKAPDACGSVSRVPAYNLRPASYIRFPGSINEARHRNGVTDCNSPSHWDGETLYVFNSWEQPWRTSGPDLFHLSPVSAVQFNNPELKKLWIWLESTWKDERGILYGWFHNEVPFICGEGSKELPGYPIVVRCGALRSHDNGANWEDLGFILEAPATSVLCNTQSKWYAGGFGDFCALPDGQREHIYFYFVNYGSDFEHQGLCVGRLRYPDRDSQRGKLVLWDGNGWNEPGLGGYPMPIFPASVNLTLKKGQTFWGPSIHWNTVLNQYVMLLNRIADTSWATEGLYVSFNPKIEDIQGWTAPQKFMDRTEAVFANPKQQGNGWYVQAMGTGKGETDKLAGGSPRIFVDGSSRWELVFLPAV